jgi:hypothetical protein
MGTSAHVGPQRANLTTGSEEYNPFLLANRFLRAQRTEMEEANRVARRDMMELALNIIPLVLSPFATQIGQHFMPPAAPPGGLLSMNGGGSSFGFPQHFRQHRPPYAPASAAAAATPPVAPRPFINRSASSPGGATTSLSYNSSSIDAETDSPP